MFGAFGTSNQNNTSAFAASGSQQQGQNAAGTAGTSIFGNPAQNNATPAATGTSVFGNPGATSVFGLASNTNQPGSGGSGVFGNASGQAPGSAFGGAANQQQQPATNNIFGNTSNNDQQSATGNVFGNNQQPSTSSVFGNTGNQQTGSSLFGGASLNQQPAGSSIFGANNSQPQQMSGGGLFGNTSNQQQPTGSSFGNNPNQQSGGSGSIFGQQLTPSGNMFGSSTQAQNSSNVFGSSNSTNPLFGNKTPGSIFGSQTQTSGPNTNSSSIFGQSANTQQPASSIFGQSQQSRPAGTGSLFGMPSTNTYPASSLFASTLAASSSNPLLSSRTTAGLPPQQADVHSQFANLTQRIEAIGQAWDSTSPQCAFQHYLYNLVEPSQVALYTRPSNTTNEALWQKAVHDNPDPTCLVPVLATGFDGLRERADAQSQQAAAQQEKLKELKKRLENLSQQHEVSNASRAQRAAALRAQISHRLLKLIQHLHLLIPALRSSSIRPEEEALRVALEEMEEDIRRPGGMGKLKGKLNELWALVGAVNAAQERGRKAGIDGHAEWTVVDEDGLKQIAQILTEQQAGLQHLTKVLRQNLKDLAVIKGENADEDTVHLFSSSLTPRESMAF